MKNLSRKRRTEGFTLLEIILLLSVFILIGFLGIGLYNFSQKNNDSEKTSQESTRKSNNQPSPTKEVVFLAHDKQVLVDAFYDEYLAEQQTPPPSLVELAEKYGTVNFVNYVSESSGGDPVLCGQQGKSQARASSVIDGQDIVVTISYSSDNSPQIKFTTAVENRKLLIDSATCL